MGAGSVAMIAIALAILSDTPELLWLRVSALVVTGVAGTASAMMFARVGRELSAREEQRAQQRR